MVLSMREPCTIHDTICGSVCITKILVHSWKGVRIRRKGLEIYSEAFIRILLGGISGVEGKRGFKKALLEGVHMASSHVSHKHGTYL